MTIREMKPSEYGELENFLYEAIYVPADEDKPPRKIIERPELQVYVENFGAQPADVCFVAEVDGKIVGACWSPYREKFQATVAVRATKKFGGGQPVSQVEL